MKTLKMLQIRHRHTDEKTEDVFDKRDNTEPRPATVSVVSHQYQCTL